MNSILIKKFSTSTGNKRVDKNKHTVNIDKHSVENPIESVIKTLSQKNLVACAGAGENEEKKGSSPVRIAYTWLIRHSARTIETRFTFNLKLCSPRHFGSREKRKLDKKLCTPERRRAVLRRKMEYMFTALGP